MAGRHMSVFNEPQCLIDTDSDNKLQINMAVIDQIATVDKQLNVVAIAGLLRTGKSYILTRLAGKDIYKGFPLGNTIQSKTKGIWAWCVDHPKNSSQKLLLLDTEGLGDPEKADTDHDNQLFSLAILLSSTLIYNMMGVLTEDAIEKLNFITDLSKHIKTSERSGGMGGVPQFDVYFPDFILTLRDFTLELEADGKPITSDEYLERNLKMTSDKAGRLSKKNEVRRCLINFFRNRKCFVFDRPGGKKILKALETFTDDDLDEDFVEQTSLLTKHVYAFCRPMALRRGNPVNGRMFKSLAVCYVEAIRNGAVPCIESALKSMTTIENEKAVENAMKLYKDMMWELPIPSSDEIKLNQHHSKCHGYASEQFSYQCVLDDELFYKRKLEDKIRKAHNGILHEHNADSMQRCDNLLTKLHKKIGRNIKNSVYARKGGFAIYQADMKQLQQTYKATGNLGLKKEEVYAMFIHMAQKESDSILNADKMIEEKEKEIIRERKKAKQAAKVADERAEELSRKKREDIESQERQRKAIEREQESYRRKYEEQMRQTREVEWEIEMQRKEFRRQRELIARGLKLCPFCHQRHMHLYF